AKETMQRLLLEDLNRYLGLFGRMEKRKIKCWALVRDNMNDTTTKTRSIKPVLTDDELTGNRIFRNKPIQFVVSSFNSLTSPAQGKPIFLDETAINFNVDIEIPQSAFGDPAKLTRALATYGLRLIPVEREIDMFILTESNFKSSNLKPI